MSIWTGISNWFTKNGGSVLNTAANLWSTYQQNKNVDKSIAAQAEENEKQREYERDTALEMWNLNNEYNSPSAQKARLEQAGLNADLMYGQGGVSNTSSGAASPSSVAPTDWSALAGKRTIGDSVSQMLDNKLKQAQIDNINADTSNKGQENRILSSDADFRDAYNQGILDSTYSTIHLQGKQSALTDAQVTEIQHKIQKIDAEVQSLNEGILQIRNSIKNDNARLDMEKLLNNATVRKIGAECNLTNKQAERLVNEWEYLVTNYEDIHGLNLLQHGRLELENQELRLDIRTNYGTRDRDLSGWENAMMFFNQLNRYVLPKLVAK